MAKSTLCAALVAITVCGGSLAASAGAGTQDPAVETKACEGESVDFDEGWSYYLRYCKNCHGEEGKGDGRIAYMLKEEPADLTLLSERNDGVFPQERVARVIDGRVDGDIHGRREMPIWGRVFREIEEIGPDEGAVHEKVCELTEIMESLDRSVQEVKTP